MKRSIAQVSLLVPDYDEAIAYFTGVLGFELLDDQPDAPERRWVVVAPKGAGGAKLLLAKASTSEQQALIGNQAGGRVWLFLETDDFDGDYARLISAGVAFLEQPRDEPYGRVAKFRDLYGNPWDLLQPRLVNG